MGWYVDVSVKLKSNIKLCASIVLALVEALKLFSSLFRPWNLVKPDLPRWLLLLLLLLLVQLKGTSCRLNQTCIRAYPGGHFN